MSVASDCESAALVSGYKFATGQRIFCYHGPVMYEAKPMQLEMRNGLPHYLIHYHGWNKNWDEWVPEERIREHTPENERLAAVQREKERNKPKLPKGQKRKSMGSNSSISSSAGSTPTLTSIKIETDGVAGSEKVERKQSGGKESSVAKHSTSGKESTNGKHYIKVKDEPKPEKESSQTSLATVTTAVSETASTESVVGTTPGPVPGEKRERRKRRSKLQMKEAEAREKERLRELEMSQNEGAEEDYLRIPISRELMALLVDDQHMIQQSELVVNLSAAKSVYQLLEDFAAFSAAEDRNQTKDEDEGAFELSDTSRSSSQDSQDSEIRREVINGLKMYFNAVLGKQLLYKNERLQYLEVLEKHTASVQVNDHSTIPVPQHLESKDQDGSSSAGGNKSTGGFRSRKNSSATSNNSADATASKASNDLTHLTNKHLVKPDLTKLYAPIHLLRMFTKIGRYMANIPDSLALQLLLYYIGKVADYMHRHRDELFSAKLYHRHVPTGVIVPSGTSVTDSETTGSDGGYKLPDNPRETATASTNHHHRMSSKKAMEAVRLHVA